jgi:glutamate racemase
MRPPDSDGVRDPATERRARNDTGSGPAADGDAGPIGVFDSGVGGLSVLRAIREELPAEDLLYVADSAFAPYGDRSHAFIEERAMAILDFFLRRQVKAVVVACNTATAAAVETLRRRHTLPIVAMEPAVKPAVTRTRTGVVGVLATTRTLSSSSFLKLVDRHGAGVQVLVQPCPGLVEQVERGELATDATRALIERYVRPVLARGADTLVLGCTHYPFLRPLIEEVAGPSVSLIDPATAVARELRRRLQNAKLLGIDGRRGTEEFWTSATPAAVTAVIAQLWHPDVEVRPMPEETTAS